MIPYEKWSRDLRPNPGQPVYFCAGIHRTNLENGLVRIHRLRLAALTQQTIARSIRYPQLLGFREHASRFAHQLDDALGHHSLSSSSEEDRMVVFQTLSSMIGSGWMRYKVWEATDPEELIVGGNFDGTPLWKRQEPDYIEIDRLMCGQCEIATFARRFLFHANLPLFRRLYRSGVIYVANRATTPWEATIFAVASNPVSTFYDNLDTEYHQSLRYYDEVVGATEHL